MAMSTSRPAAIDTLLTALAPVIWGSTYIVTTELLRPDRPATAAGCDPCRGLPLSVDGRRTVRGIARLPPVAVSSLGLLSPVTAVVLGWILLGQSMTRVSFAGLVLVLTIPACSACS